MVPGTKDVQPPANYKLTPGKDFLTSLSSSWDLGKSSCPSSFFSVTTATPAGKCHVPGNISTVAAACNALPACNG